MTTLSGRPERMLQDRNLKPIPIPSLDYSTTVSVVINITDTAFLLEGLTAGALYFIQVFPNALLNDATVFNFCVTNSAAPTNANFLDPIIIGIKGTAGFWDQGTSLFIKLNNTQNVISFITKAGLGTVNARAIATRVFV